MRLPENAKNFKILSIESRVETIEQITKLARQKGISRNKLINQLMIQFIREQTE